MRHDLAQAGALAAEIVDEDFAVEVRFDKAVGAVVELGLSGALVEAQGIEIGFEMPAHAIGADQLQGADRIGRRRGATPRHRAPPVLQRRPADERHRPAPGRPPQLGHDRRLRRPSAPRRTAASSRRPIRVVEKARVELADELGIGAGEKRRGVEISHQRPVMLSLDYAVRRRPDPARCALAGSEYREPPRKSLGALLLCALHKDGWSDDGDAPKQVEGEQSASPLTMNIGATVDGQLQKLVVRGIAASGDPLGDRDQLGRRQHTCQPSQKVAAGSAARSRGRAKVIEQLLFGGAGFEQQAALGREHGPLSLGGECLLERDARGRGSLRYPRAPSTIASNCEAVRLRRSTSDACFESVGR